MSNQTGSLMLVLGGIMPEQMIVEELEKAITEWKVSPTKENRRKISMFGMLLASKDATEERGVSGILDDMDRMDKGFELLNPKKG